MPYTNFWDVPNPSGGGATQLSLASHFGSAALANLGLSWASIVATAVVGAIGVCLAGRGIGGGRPWRRLKLFRLDWVAPFKALPHGLSGVLSLGSGAFLIAQAVGGSYATVGSPVPLGIFCGSTAANAVAGLFLVSRAPLKARSAFRVSAVFQICLVYHAIRFSPACPSVVVPRLLDAAVALATLVGIACFVVSANAQLPPAVAASVLVGSFALVLLAVYPAQLAVGGEEWWTCVQAQYPQQGVGMSAYIYVPASWAFGAMLFGATLWTRKILSDVGFGGGFTALVMLVLVTTVLAQERLAG